MATQERVELEPKEPFARYKCINFSLQEHNGLFYELDEAMGFEEKILGKEVSRNAKDGTLFIPTALASVKERVSQLITQNNVVALTNKQLVELEKQTEKEIRQVGAVIRDEADNIGPFVGHQYPDEARDTIKKDRRFAFDYDVRRGDPFVFLTRKGWQIYQGNKGNYVLVVPDNTSIYARKKEQLDIVDLDGFYDLKPELLKEQIFRYYELQAIGIALRNTIYNLALHEVNERVLVPDFLEQLSSDLERRPEEVRDSLRFLERVGNLDKEYASIVIKLKDKLIKRQNLSETDGRFVDLDRYLNHMMECPSRSEATQHHATMLRHAYEQLMSINPDKIRQPQARESYVNDTRRLRRDPLRYTDIGVSEDERRIKDDQASSTQFAEFIEHTKDIKNPEQFLQELQQRLPDTYLLLERFRDSLGKDYLGRDKLDELIKETSSNLRYAINRKQISEIIAKRLSNSNDELRDTLSLLAIKKAQEDLLKQDKNQFYRERDEQSQKLDRVVDAVARKYREMIDANDERLGDLDQNRKKMRDFLAQTGISEEVVNNLATLVEKSDLYKKYRNDTSFTVAFNALFFSSLGQLDIKSRSFRLLVKEVFPYVENEILDRLQSAS